MRRANCGSPCGAGYMGTAALAGLGFICIWLPALHHRRCRGRLQDLVRRRIPRFRYCLNFAMRRIQLGTVIDSMPFPGSWSTLGFRVCALRSPELRSGLSDPGPRHAVPCRSVVSCEWRARRAPRHPSLIFSAESDLPINVSRLFYREMGGALFLGGLQPSERRDPRAP